MSRVYVDPLAEAEHYGHELTPAENRRRLNRMRAKASENGGNGGEIPGQARNAGSGNSAEGKQFVRSLFRG